MPPKPSQKPKSGPKPDAPPLVSPEILARLAIAEMEWTERVGKLKADALAIQRAMLDFSKMLAAKDKDKSFSWLYIGISIYAEAALANLVNMARTEPDKFDEYYDYFYKGWQVLQTCLVGSPAALLPHLKMLLENKEKDPYLPGLVCLLLHVLKSDMDPALLGAKPGTTFLSQAMLYLHAVLKKKDSAHEGCAAFLLFSIFTSGTFPEKLNSVLGAAFHPIVINFFKISAGNKKILQEVGCEIDVGHLVSAMEKPAAGGAAAKAAMPSVVSGGGSLIRLVVGGHGAGLAPVSPEQMKDYKILLAALEDKAIRGYFACIDTAIQALKELVPEKEMPILAARFDDHFTTDPLKLKSILEVYDKSCVEMKPAEKALWIMTISLQRLWQVREGHFEGVPALGAFAASWAELTEVKPAAAKKIADALMDHFLQIIDLVKVKKQIAEAKMEVAEAEQRNKALQAEVEFFRAQIAAKEAELAEKAEKVKGVGAEIDSLKRLMQEVSAEIKAVTALKQRLERELGTAPAETRTLEEMEAEIARLKVEVDPALYAKLETDHARLEALVESPALLRLRRIQPELNLPDIIREAGEMRARPAVQKLLRQLRWLIDKIPSPPERALDPREAKIKQLFDGLQVQCETIVSLFMPLSEWESRVTKEPIPAPAFEPDNLSYRYNQAISEFVTTLPAGGLKDLLLHFYHVPPRLLTSEAAGGKSGVELKDLLDCDPLLAHFERHGIECTFAGTMNLSRSPADIDLVFIVPGRTDKEAFSQVMSIFPRELTTTKLDVEHQHFPAYWQGGKVKIDVKVIGTAEPGAVSRNCASRVLNVASLLSATSGQTSCPHEAMASILANRLELLRPKEVEGWMAALREPGKASAEDRALAFRTIVCFLKKHFDRFGPAGEKMLVAETISSAVAVAEAVKPDPRFATLVMHVGGGAVDPARLVTTAEMVRA